MPATPKRPKVAILHIEDELDERFAGLVAGRLEEIIVPLRAAWYPVHVPGRGRKAGPEDGPRRDGAEAMLAQDGHFPGWERDLTFARALPEAWPRDAKGTVIRGDPGSGKTRSTEGGEEAGARSGGPACALVR